MNTPEKDAQMAKAKQNHSEAEHMNNNAFVKRQQMATAKYAGKSPNLSPEALKFNAYQSNTGAHAQQVARDVTKGLDKDAFPVK